MSDYVWSYIINTFLVATRSSFKLAVRIAKDHDAALFASKSDPEINAMYLVFHPIYLHLQATYEAWVAQGGTQSGETLSLQLLLKELSKNKIKNWDISVQVVFDSKSVEYKKLLPNHRLPFQVGSQDDKIAAVSAFSTNLIGIANLTSVATSVNSFMLLLKDARDVHQVSMKTTGNLSTDCENARIAMCKKMFGNYGRLIGINEEDPTLVVPFFPIKYIRSNNQVFFTHSIKEGGKHVVVKHKFKAADRIVITTNTAAGIKVFLGLTKDDTGSLLSVTLGGNSTTTITAAQLGAVDTHSFLIVLNLDPAVAADYDIEFL